MFFFVLCLLCLCARMFIRALWSPAGQGLTSWLSFVVSNCEFVTFPGYPGSGVVLDCIVLIFAPLLNLKSHFWRKKVIIALLCTCMQRCYGRHNVSRKPISH